MELEQSKRSLIQKVRNNHKGSKSTKLSLNINADFVRVCNFHRKTHFEEVYFEKQTCEKYSESGENQTCEKYSESGEMQTCEKYFESGENQTYEKYSESGWGGTGCLF